ncbi:unnamed protein product [Penicillium camemberti]|uniref:Str. FM013 n=1 Tax=Penicillium camemberti (strain FM 013) TaxID=1429867 RepID=A0A0G4P596_PENC3|nr:unnamed protein product [Penicillium camemberti]
MRPPRPSPSRVSACRLGLSSQSGCKYDARDLVTDEVLTIDSAIEIQLDSHVGQIFGLPSGAHLARFKLDQM